MLSINTNLSSLILQQNLQKSTKNLNQVIERMITGAKINHASDNAANFSIANSMESKISSLETASENVAMGNDLASTATDNLDLVSNHLQRIRDLLEQSSNGTYGEGARKAIQSEVDSRLKEINRIISNCEFNDIKLFNAGILPPSSQIALTDFGMSSGNIEFETDDSTYTVHLTNDDTLFSMMTKLEAVGIKSSFDEDTGMFSCNLNASKVSDSGTGFKSIFGISDTDGYRAEGLEENVEMTSVEVADLSTQLNRIGITNGSFAIVDSNGVETEDNISTNATIQDLFTKLADYNITGSIDDNGVISLDTNGNYIKGVLANQLGITYKETNDTERSGISANTTNTLTKTTIVNATGATTLSQVGAEVGDTLEIRNNSGDVIWSLTADSAFLETSLNDMFSTLTSNGMSNASINNGVITLSSTTNNYVTGTIADKLGIGVNTTGSVTTNAASQTSSSAVTYNTTQIATTSSTFAQMGINTNNAVEVYNSEGTKVGQFNLTQSSTLGEFLGSINAINTNANATLTNGVISIDNGYVSGSIATAFGLTMNTSGSTSTQAKAQTSSAPVMYTVSQVATTSNTFAQLNISTNNPVEVYNRAGMKVGQFNMTQSSTLGELIGSINSLTTSGNATLNNGVITIGSGYITGDIATALGLNSVDLGVVANNADNCFFQHVDQIDLTGLSTYVSGTTTYTVVRTAAELQSALNDYTNIILAKDIDLTGINWSPISSLSHRTLDGNGHVISNLSISSGTTDYNVGLIGDLGIGGQIKNLGLVTVNVTSTGSVDYPNNYYVGALVGASSVDSVIDNCFVLDANVTFAGGGRYAYAGVMGGNVYGTVSNINVMRSRVDNYASDSSQVGGLVAHTTDCNVSNVNIYDVTLNAEISSSGYKYAVAGGAIGASTRGTCNNVRVYGTNITVTNCNDFENHIGGLIGSYGYYNGSGLTPTNCSVDVTISDTSTESYIGRMVGWYSCIYQTEDVVAFTSCTYNSSMTSSITKDIGYIASAYSTCTISGTVAISATITTPTSISSAATSITFSQAYGSSSSNNINASSQQSINNSTTLSNLGLSNSSFTMNNGTVVNIASGDSIVSKLQGAGLSTSISNGKLTINGDSSHYITAMDSALASALKISVGENYTWETIGSVTYSSSDSSTVNATVQKSITNSTTLSNLGLSSASFTTNNGTVNITSSDSIVSKLQNAGLGININNGQLTVTGDSSHYIKSMDSALASALKIQTGENYTYTVTGQINHSNTNSNTQTVREVTTLSTSNSNSLTMSDLGLTTNGTITTNKYVVTVNQTDLMSEVLTKLNNAGITAVINDSNGTLLLTGSAQDYITDVSTNLKNLLGLTTGEGNTYTSTTITTRSDSASKSQTYTNTYTVQQTATENTLLSNFNSDTNQTEGKLVFSTDDGFKTVDIQSDDTIKTFRKKLANQGISSDFSNGTLTISSNNGSISMVNYGSETTSQIADLMGLSYNAVLDNYSTSSNINMIADAKYAENVDVPSRLTIQVGITGNEEDVISIDTNLALGRVSFDALTTEGAVEGLGKVDKLLNAVTQKQQDYAAFSNRLDSASESIFSSIENLTSSLSTIKDADIAEASSEYIRQQILQQACATLLATANQTPSIALQLL